MNKYIYHILLVIMTLMTTWTFSSCSDESMFNVDSNTFDNSQITISAFLPDDKELSTRVSYESIAGKKGLHTKWEDGDKIVIHNIETKNNYTFTYNISDDSWTCIDNSATFSKEDKLVAVYNPQGTIDNNTATMMFNKQDGTEENYKSHDLMISEIVIVTSGNIEFHLERQNVFLRIAVEKQAVEDYIKTDNGVTITLIGTTGYNVENGLVNSSLDLSDCSYTKNGDGNISFKILPQGEFTEKNELNIDTEYYLYYVVVPSYDGIVSISSIEVTTIVKETYRDWLGREKERDVTKTLASKTYTTRNTNLKMVPGYVYRTKLGNLSEVNLLPGNKFIEELKELTSNNLNNISQIVFENQSELVPTGNDKEVQSEESEFKAYARYNNGTVTIFSEADVIYANADASSMFKGLANLSTFGNLQLLKTSKTQNMSSMFENCISFRQIDVSTFDTQSVTDMSSMFKGCSNLLTVNTKSLFNTSNVTNMSSMFEGCKSINFFNNIIANFDTNSVKDMSSMFKDCLIRNKMEVSFSVRDVENMSHMFEGCVNIPSLNFNFSDARLIPRLLNTEGMFKNCSSLKSINISGLNTTRVENMSYMFYGCSSLRTLNLSGFNTFYAMKMTSMFENCSSLTDLDISSFDTDNLYTLANVLLDANQKHMNRMFCSCSNLNNLKLGNNFAIATRLTIIVDLITEYFDVQDAFLNMSSVSGRCNIYCSQQTGTDIQRSSTIGYDSNRHIINP